MNLASASARPSQRPRVASPAPPASPASPLWLRSSPYYLTWLSHSPPSAARLGSTCRFMLHHAFAALRSISVNGAQRCSIMQHPRRPHGIELPQLARLQQRAPRLCDALLVMPPCVVGRFEASRHLLAVSGSLASLTRVAGCDVLVAAAAQLLLGSPIERLTIDWRRCSTAVVEKFWRGLRAHQRGFDTLRELTVLRSCRHAPSRRAEDVTALATFGGRVTMRASELETITIDASFLCILTPTHAQKFKDSLTAWVTQTSSRTKMCAIRFTGTPSRPQCRLVPFRNDAELDDNSTSLSPVPHPARRVIFLPPLAGCRRLVVTVRRSYATTYTCPSLT